MKKAGITVSLFIPIVLGLCFTPSASATAWAISINSVRYGTIGSYNSIVVNVTNFYPSTLNLVPFAVWKNSQGQTVAVTTAGLTLPPGASGVAFAPLLNPPTPGHYLVFVFVVITSNQPVSTVATLSVYIS